MQISINLNSNIVYVNVDYEMVNEYTQFAYYLYDKNKTNISKILWSASQSCSFELVNASEYYVRVFVRNKKEKDDEWVKVSENSEMFCWGEEEDKEESCIDFEVECQIEDNNLIIITSPTVEDTECQYAYYFFEVNKGLIKNVPYGEESTYSLALTESGYYYARVFLRKKSSKGWIKTDKVLKPLYYCSEVDRDNYSNFIKSKREIPSRKLPFQKIDAPWCDMLMVVENTNAASTKLDSLEKSLDMKLLKIEKENVKISIFLTKEISKLGNISYAFSGMGRTSEELIYDESDIKSEKSLEELVGSIGEFWLLRYDEKTISLDMDFYGNNKMVYYKDEDLFIISNRMHLGLLAMQVMNIPRVPNFKKISAWLSTNARLFLHNYSTELNIEGLSMLLADSRVRVEVESGNVSIEKTGLYDLLSQDYTYTDAKYKQLLEETKEEILDNARVALKYHGFDNFLVNITGGMDSRIVLAALSNFPEYREKLIAKTYKKRGEEDDWEVAMKCLAEFPISFKCDSNIKSVTRSEDFNGISYMLGITPVYYSSRNQYNVYERTCTFCGNYGEVVNRIYYATSCFGTALENEEMSAEEFYSTIIGKYRKFYIYDATESLSELFGSACEELPGKNNLKKYENHYLYYRSALQCAGVHRYNLGARPLWSILQSKKMLELKQIMFNKNTGMRMAFDLLEMLNPNLATVEFANNEYNKEQERLNIRCSNQKEDNNEVISKIKEDWAMNIPHDVGGDTNLDKESILNIWHAIVTRYSLDFEMAERIYHYICDDNCVYRKNFLYIKIFSLWYELNI